MAEKHRINQKFYFGRPTWRNSTKTLKAHPLKYYYPENKKDLIEIVREGIEHNVSVRAVGSGHSYSKAPLASGLLVDMSKLDHLKPYHHSIAVGHFFDVEAGIKVEALNTALDKAGYCLSAMGGIDHQSIAGAISTGTHGSSLKYGAMSKMVKSIVLITHDKIDDTKIQTYRIEPTKGFTDPTKCPEELIADDEVFFSALVCFGSLGLIYSYVLEVEPMYHLREKKSLRPWKEVRNDLENGLPDRHDSVMVLVNPYTKGENRSALVTTHDRVPKGEENLILQDLKRKVLFPLKRFSRSFLYELVSRFPLFFWISVWNFNKKPQNIAKLLDTAVKSQRDEEYLNKGYKVMYQGLDYIKERAYDCEFAVRMNGNHYLEVLDQLMIYLQHIHELYQVNITSPIGLRFVAASPAFLTAEYGQDVCYIDTPVLLHAYGRETILDHIQSFMLDKNAIPHWGKINDQMDYEHVQQRFPKFRNFRKQLLLFNRHKIFSNKFTRQVLDY